MNILLTHPGRLPDHTQLPETDGSIVENFQQPFQSQLLTDSIQPVMERLHPDRQYTIGQDSGIYWRITDPPLAGCKAPDWFYVPGVPPMLEGQFRRSYVMWQEVIAPLLILEYVSGDGSEERDSTAWTGKFWVYEQAIRAPYYGIFDPIPERLEVHRLVEGHYQILAPNDRGRVLIAPLGVELGIWHGRYANMDLAWLRWWDGQGNLLLTGAERAEQERQRAEQQRQRAESLAEKLRSLGIKPELP